MAGVVGSVFAQECLSKAISFVLGRREEKASQGFNAERLEMAVSQLEFALERTAKLPVTELSLLHRRQMIKRAYLEGTELLSKHKQQQALKEGKQEEVVQARSRWARAVTIRGKKNLSISSSFAVCLKTDDVRRFEWFADHAGKFVRDVESGCSLRHHTFCSPIVRHLLEGKTLRHQLLLQGSGRLRRGLYMQPICLEGRGVETVLIYRYRDHCKTSSTANKSFNLVLILRLSESTDIVRTAIACLQWVASQFKIETPTEAAMGELTLLTDVQYTSHPYAARCHAEIDQDSYGEDTRYLRPDPVCCNQANLQGPCANSVLPEQVIHFFFRCSSSALNCCSSLDEAPGKRRRPAALLDVTIGCLPHHVYRFKEQQQQQLQESCYALEINGDDGQERIRGASVADGAETLRSKATSFFLRQPAELTEYRMLWIYRHGVAGFFLEKQGMERGRAPRARTSARWSTSSRLAAACHRSMSLRQRRGSLKRQRTEDQCHDGHACPFGPWAV